MKRTVSHVSNSCLSNLTQSAKRKQEHRERAAIDPSLHWDRAQVLLVKRCLVQGIPEGRLRGILKLLIHVRGLEKDYFEEMSCSKLDFSQNRAKFEKKLNFERK